MNPTVRKRLEDAVFPVLGTLVAEHGAEAVAVELQVLAAAARVIERKQASRRGPPAYRPR